MILFLNGPFGVGKTTVAKLLVERLPRAMLYDPEVIGIFVRRLTEGMEEPEDFQDNPLWTPMVVEAARMLREEYGRSLIIPMTVWRRDRFEDIARGLRDFAPDLACFRLTASKGELVRRIESDSEDPGAYGWRTSHLEVSLAASRDPAFGMEIRTDDLSPSRVADEILSTIGGGGHEARDPYSATRMGSWS